jgi:hypothetical protein
MAAAGNNGVTVRTQRTRALGKEQIILAVDALRDKTINKHKVVNLQLFPFGIVVHVACQQQRVLKFSSKTVKVVVFQMRERHYVCTYKINDI